MATVYRADTIGSLLRPPYLKIAREQFEAGQLEPAAYKEIEDRAVDQAIAMQEGVGLDVVTDGELRRHTFIDQLTEQVFGLPGLGYTAIHAIEQQNLPVIIGIVLVASAGVVVANILADLFYAVLDPRVRAH